MHSCTSRKITYRRQYDLGARRSSSPSPSLRLAVVQVSLCCGRDIQERSLPPFLPLLPLINYSRKVSPGTMDRNRGTRHGNKEWGTHIPQSHCIWTLLFLNLASWWLKATRGVCDIKNDQKVRSLIYISFGSRKFQLHSKLGEIVLKVHCQCS